MKFDNTIMNFFRLIRPLSARPLRVGLAALLICVPLTMSIHAQDTDEVDQEKPAEKIKGRKAWFLCTEIPDDIDNPVSVMAGEKIQQVTLSIRHVSDPFAVRGEGIVRLVKEIPNPENPDVTAYQTLVESKVPKDIENALIILVPAPDQKNGKAAFLSKVLDLNSFKGGDYLYLNLSPRKVGILLGDSRSVLEPGAMKIQENRQIKAATNLVMSLHYESQEKDEWKMIVATTVVVQPTRREICIFHWDAKQSRMDFRGATFPVEID